MRAWSYLNIECWERWVLGMSVFGGAREVLSLVTFVSQNALLVLWSVVDNADNCHVHWHRRSSSLSLPAQPGICCAETHTWNMTSQPWSGNWAAEGPWFYQEPDNGAEGKNLWGIASLALYQPTHWCPSPSGSVCSSAELCREDDGEVLRHWWWGEGSSQIVFSCRCASEIAPACIPPCPALLVWLPRSLGGAAQPSLPDWGRGTRPNWLTRLSMLNDLQRKPRGLGEGRRSLQMLMLGLRCVRV